MALTSETWAADTQVMTQPFPESFMFGTAIAGFQVDMGCPTLAASVCEDKNSDWYQWITSAAINKNPLLFMSGQGPGVGPGFFELYDQDISNARQELHNNSLRLSIEWSRIFPKPSFAAESFEDLHALASPEALSFYHNVFASLKAQGLKPMVTLNHYTLPLWMHDAVACHKNLRTCTRKGWLDRALIVKEIAKYAGFVAREFGGEVDLWATLNEPFTAVVLPSYLLPSPSRVNPPGLTLHIREAKLASLAMIEAHARMYDAVKANDTVDSDGDGTAASVGLVYAVTTIAPATQSRKDRKAAASARHFFNGIFLQGVTQGIVDEKWDGKTVVRADLQNRMDFLGVNYYLNFVVKHGGLLNPGKLISSQVSFDPLRAVADSNYPLGIYDALLDMKKYQIPMYITETGSDTEQGETQSNAWLVKTLALTRQAIADGIDVRGYYYWSLTDNFEWNHGMNQKFGLYSINPIDPSKNRQLKSVGKIYSEVCEQGRLTADMLQGLTF